MILMQHLKHFVDIVEGVHSGGTTLFGLRKGKPIRDQLSVYLELFRDKNFENEVIKKLTFSLCKNIKVDPEKKHIYIHTFITPITPSAASRGQLMERMAG